MKTGTATARSDSTAAFNTQTFAVGETSKTVSATTIDDSAVEGETMVLNLTNTTGGATISDAQGIGTIDDNDTASGPVTINLSRGGGANLRRLANSNGCTGATNNFVMPSGTTISGLVGGGTMIDTSSWPADVTLSLSINGKVSGGGGGAGWVDIAALGAAGGTGVGGVSCGAPFQAVVVMAATAVARRISPPSRTGAAAHPTGTAALAIAESADRAAPEVPEVPERSVPAEKAEVVTTPFLSAALAAAGSCRHGRNGGRPQRRGRQLCGA